MLPVTFRGLEVFVAVVESGGFGAAASALGISQPSVSVHVRDLETKLGNRLFDRHPGAAPQLTDAGRAYYAYALETLERTTAVSSDIRKAKRKLRFAAQRFVADQLLAKPLSEFAAQFPQIELIARSGTFEEVHASCRSGHADLGFMLSDGEVPSLATEPLGRYRLAIIASPNHPLAHASDIPVQELANHAFVVAHSASYFGRTIASMLAAAGLSRINIALQAQDMNMVRGMVIAGVGIACSLRRAVQDDIVEGKLVELDVAMEPMHLWLRYFQSANTDTVEIRELITLIQRNEKQRV